VNHVARQLLPVVFLSACSASVPRITLQSASGTQPMGAWYGVFLEPLEGPNSSPIARLVVAFVDESWACSGDFTGDAVSFSFDVFSAGSTSSTVLSRSGPDLSPTSGGSGQVTLDHVDDRYQGQGDGGPIVADGGHLDGHADFDFGGGVRLKGSFRAPHCPALDFRNAP
jgi:hypothetical protein